LGKSSGLNMKALTVNAFYVDKIKGGVFMELEYSLEDSITIDARPFSHEEAANIYLASIKRTWLMQAFETWINHKRRIIEAYPNAEKQAIFNQLWAAYSEMEEGRWRLDRVCARIVKGEQHLQAILPGESNPSRASSFNNLQEIIKFCKNEIKAQ
jgi:hypothetical protein